jgi:dinuclear metal center YbgI/SA1388 family protein
MKISEIFATLDTLSPFALQEEWDNSGLLVGAMSDEVERIYVSLDIDSKLLAEVEPNSLIITHHPLIFGGLKRIDETYPASLVRDLIRKNCAVIAMHTNIDKTHLGRYVLEQVLGFKASRQDGFVCYFEQDGGFDELCARVKKAFGLEVLRVAPSDEPRAKTCAFCTGSGGDLIGEVEADTFISGDLKYHQALAAREDGISLIDIGHFESERYFSQMLGEILKNLPIRVIITNSENPFQYR